MPDINSFVVKHNIGTTKTTVGNENNINNKGNINGT